MVRASPVSLRYYDLEERAYHHWLWRVCFCLELWRWTLRTKLDDRTSMLLCSPECSRFRLVVSCSSLEWLGCYLGTSLQNQRSATISSRSCVRSTRMPKYVALTS